MGLTSFDRCPERNTCVLGAKCVAGWCQHTDPLVFVNWNTVECPICKSTRQLTVLFNPHESNVVWTGPWKLKCLMEKVWTRKSPVIRDI